MTKSTSPWSICSTTSALVVHSRYVGCRPSPDGQAHGGAHLGLVAVDDHGHRIARLRGHVGIVSAPLTRPDSSMCGEPAAPIR
jgi:hypothetical protein